MSFAAETAAGNTETGMQISAITTDVTSGSEDFDFVLRLMAAGATAAEVFRVRSTGTALVSAILDAAGGNTATINGVTPALSSQAQAQAGTENTTQMTPLRVSQAITALNGTATAALSVGAVGTYAFLSETTNSTVNAGDTRAGSNLYYAGVGIGTVPSTSGEALGAGWGSQPSGTWRAMGYAAINGGAGRYNTTVWLRIS
jgi:hypothetical protein